jgi:RNA polymerase-interacting CarD/CdnL/TRCF family regulator
VGGTTVMHTLNRKSNQRELEIVERRLHSVELVLTGQFIRVLLTVMNATS